MLSDLLLVLGLSLFLFLSFSFSLQLIDMVTLNMSHLLLVYIFSRLIKINNNNICIIETFSIRQSLCALNDN